MIRLLIAAAALLGLSSFFTKKDGKPAPALPRPRARAHNLVWNEKEARAATCAALTQGIDDEDTLAKLVGEALYPGTSWPPPESSSTRHKNVWAKLQATARDAIAGGCAK